VLLLNSTAAGSFKPAASNSNSFYLNISKALEPFRAAAAYAELGASPAGGSLALLSLLLLSATGCLKLRSASSSPVFTR
jgi:hypothetical protein